LQVPQNQNEQAERNLLRRRGLDPDDLAEQAVQCGIAQGLEGVWLDQQMASARSNGHGQAHPMQTIWHFSAVPWPFGAAGAVAVVAEKG